MPFVWQPSWWMPSVLSLVLCLLDLLGLCGILWVCSLAMQAVVVPA